MAEIIDSIYSEEDIADFRRSGHWPPETELETKTESEETVDGNGAVETPTVGA